MRKARKEDIDFVAGCFISIVRDIKENASDIYIDRLPEVVDEKIRAIASDYIENPKAITLIIEDGDNLIACLAGKIEETSMPVSGVGKIGNIAICWVAPEDRNKGIAKKLVRRAEHWFQDKGVKVIELSYIAQNSLAEMAWTKLGYSPFRIYAHKELKKS